MSKYKNEKYVLSFVLCACVRSGVRACGRTCVRAFVCACVRSYVRVYVQDVSSNLII